MPGSRSTKWFGHFLEESFEFIHGLHTVEPSPCATVGKANKCRERRHVVRLNMRCEGRVVGICREKLQPRKLPANVLQVCIQLLVVRIPRRPEVNHHLVSADGIFEP